ncbi:MAG: hypothetical protein ACYDBB_18390 [Armatimonadota bacterium]
MNIRITFFGLLLLTLLSALAALAAPRPAVLFVGNIHSTYVAKPLQQMGIEVDVCGAGELAAKLATKQYNVVVPLVNNPAMQQPIEEFLKQGGGVLVMMPFGHISQQNNWFPNPEWAAGYGARLRWEALTETDPANSATDMLGAPMSWSTQVAPPVNTGVRQVLTLVARQGWWPPQGFDFSKDWTVVVRFAPSVKAGKLEVIPERLRPYIPQEPYQGALPLMGVRQVGAGRMGLVGIGVPWSFSSPSICPAVDAMLGAGANGKPSDWLRVYANTFHWLAEPSLKAGFGGAQTPDKVLNPISKQPDAPPILWDTPNPGKNVIPMGDMPQLKGLVGARTVLSTGTGTVDDYAKAARAAGLDYIVFLEDALNMDTGKFQTLVEQCTAASDDAFAAIPGLTYEDAQGDHLFTLGDNTKFPKPEMMLPDGRLATTEVSRTEVMFKYIFQYMNYRNVFGFWNHKKNFLPIADYKLYNSFPIYSFENGKPVDDAFDDFLYLSGWGGCQPVFALEFMTEPAQVAKRAVEGWKVVATIPKEFGDGSYKLSLPAGVKGLREKWRGSLGWWPPFQYITNGPQILSWDCQNICSIPSGEWWRPDLWEYRARLHVASEKGLKAVTIYDGDRGIFRRWLPGGAKSFTQDMVLSHDLQRDLVLVVEDTAGGRAISMELWNRNTMNNQYICGDRCNFLGNARLRRPDGTPFWVPNGLRENMGLTPSKGSMGDGMWVQPACSLTPGAPTLPIDGAPLSWPSPRIEFSHAVPGEYKEIHSFPSTYLMSPEIGIGQGNYRLAYDPAEYGATKTPLGHPYKDAQKQGIIGKNAWTSWYHLVPTNVLDGWSRLIAGSVLDTMRFGGYQAHLVMKRDVALPPGKGMSVLAANGKWEIYVNGVVQAIPANGELSGSFGKGTCAVLVDPGGSVVLAGTDSRLIYRRNQRTFSVSYLPANDTLKQGDAADLAVWWIGASGALSKDKLLDAARDFGILTPGTIGYRPKLARGTVQDSYLFWRVTAKNGAMEARVPKADLPNYVPLALDGLHDNWSVFLLDRKRKGQNFRAIPVRDGRAYAQLDFTAGDTELFVGHPVICDNPEITVLVSWKSPGVWFVETHNPGNTTVKARLTTNTGWGRFRFNKTIILSPGSSQVWTVNE